MDLASALIAAVPAVLVGVLGDRLSLRRKRDSDRIERSRNAADEVLATLRTLRDLVRDSEWNELHPRKWSEACGSFDQVWENNDHRFPDKWRHLHRSVRSAIGTHVGGVVTARDDNRMVDYPVAPFDPKWHENALEYTALVIRRLQEWRDVPRSNPNRSELPTFDQWLALRAGQSLADA